MRGMKFFLYGMIGLLVACGGPVGNHHVPEPKKPVELSRYLGKWYEIARYENRFEKGCEAVTAEYTQLPDGKIGILNTCREGGVNGEITTAEGKAKIVENSDNAKLAVSFFGPFYLGDYWVLDRAEDYSWSLVGEPSGRYLWILARESKLPETTQADLRKKLSGPGYDLSLLRDVKH
jgi:apolipoprotein D and lipocalin family protein